MKNTPVVGLCDYCSHKGITTYINPDDKDGLETVYYYFCKKVQRDPGQWMELAQANRDDYFGYYGYGNALDFKTAIVNCSEFQAQAVVKLTYLDYDTISGILYISWLIERGYGLEALNIYQDGVQSPIYTQSNVPDGVGSTSFAIALSQGSSTLIAQMSGGAKSLRMSLDNTVYLMITNVTILNSFGNIRQISMDYLINFSNNTDTIEYYLDGVLYDSVNFPPANSNGEQTAGWIFAITPGTHVFRLKLVTADIYSNEFILDFP